MKIYKNFTIMTDYDRCGKTQTTYLGNEFWVEFDYFAVDENGDIWNLENPPKVGNEKWVNTNNGQLKHIGNVYDTNGFYYKTYDKWKDSLHKFVNIPKLIEYFELALIDEQGEQRGCDEYINGRSDGVIATINEILEKLKTD